MNFTIEDLESYLLIVIRLAAFFATAPIFSMMRVPRKFKAGMSVFIAIVVCGIVKVELEPVGGVISFAILILQESIVGILLGFITNICLYILNFAGRVIDTEIGLAMANMLDPTTALQSSVSSSYYTQIISILFLIYDMHYYLIKAIIDSFKYVPVGQAVFDKSLYEIMQNYIVDYFIIGFRIVLPIFAAMLIINVVLGVLTKIAPQMNMFVVGMQLKVFAGLIILLIITSTLPTIADFLFDEMKEYLNIMMKALAPK